MAIDPVVKLDLSEVKRANGKLSRAAKNLRPVWKRAAPLWKKDVRDAMKKREGPQGKYKTLSKATRDKKAAQRRSPRGKKWKRKRSRGILGKLWGPLVVSYGRQRMRMISKVDWAIAHQEGLVVGRGVKLPERTHVYVTSPILDHVLKLINRRLQKAWLS